MGFDFTSSIKKWLAIIKWTNLRCYINISSFLIKVTPPISVGHFWFSIYKWNQGWKAEPMKRQKWLLLPFRLGDVSEWLVPTAHPLLCEHWEVYSLFGGSSLQMGLKISKASLRRYHRPDINSRVSNNHWLFITTSILII